MGKVKLEIKPVNHKAAVFACENYHYSKSVPAGRLIKFGVYEDDKFIGVVLYGLGANNNLGKQFNLRQGEVCELVRVALKAHKNTVSKILSITLRLIKNISNTTKMIISYADLDQNHFGVIYQATNWYYLGVQMKDRHDSSYMINGKRTHGRNISDEVKKRGGLKGLNRDDFVKKYLDKNAIKNITKGKNKYLYPLTKEMKEICEKIKKPYPKKLERINEN